MLLGPSTFFLRIPHFLRGAPVFESESSPECCDEDRGFASRGLLLGGVAGLTSCKGFLLEGISRFVEEGIRFGGRDVGWDGDFSGAAFRLLGDGSNFAWHVLRHAFSVS